MPVAVTISRRAPAVSVSARAEGTWPGSGGAGLHAGRTCCVPGADSGGPRSSAVTLGSGAFAERLPHGVVVAHRVEGDEVADRVVPHDDLVGHRVDEGPAGGCLDVRDQGQP